MAEFKAGVIGCGGRGKGHARGYTACEGVSLVACADPFEESRGAFVDSFGVDRGYEDYHEMLEKEDLDFVSVCTWTGMHREMIEAVAASGVKAIHSEKPMATTWGDAKAIMKTCDDNGVVITFCHQRQFGSQFVKAKEIANSGEIGDVYRYEGSCPNLFDWGTHWFDLFFFYNDDVPADWVIGQIDGEGTKDIFAAPCEGSGLSWIRYANGREGLLATGATGMDDNMNRILGTEGTIEIQPGRKGEPLRVFFDGKWTTPDLSDVEVLHDDATVASVLDLVDSLQTGREPELAGRKALQATELIFSTYESSRRRGKVTLPLDVDDSALISMLEDGSIKR
jgi:UDP-N-acetylglucosamine 3-dehydrogenase